MAGPAVGCAAQAGHLALADAESLHASLDLAEDFNRQGVDIGVLTNVLELIPQTARRFQAWAEGADVIQKTDLLFCTGNIHRVDRTVALFDDNALAGDDAEAQ